MIGLQGTLSQLGISPVTQEHQPENSDEGFAVLLEALLAGMQVNTSETPRIPSLGLPGDNPRAPDMKLLETLPEQAKGPEGEPEEAHLTSRLDLQMAQVKSDDAVLEILLPDKKKEHISQQITALPQNGSQENMIRTPKMQVDTGRNIPGLNDLVTDGKTENIVGKSITANEVKEINTEAGMDKHEQFRAARAEQALPKMQQDKHQDNLVFKDGPYVENKETDVLKVRESETTQKQEFILIEKGSKKTESQFKEEKESSPVKNTEVKSMQAEIRDVMFERAIKEEPIQKNIHTEKAIKIPAREIQEEFPRIIKANIQQSQGSEKGREFFVELEPKELGKMLVKLSSKDGVVSIKIFVEQAQAKSIIENNIQSLRENFFEQGIKYGRMDVEIQNEFSGSNNQQQPDWSEGKNTPQRLNWRDNLYEETETVKSPAAWNTKGSVDYFA